MNNPALQVDQLREAQAAKAAEQLEEWVEYWRREDYTWEALDLNILAQNGRSVQETLRKQAGGHGDEELIRQGLLIEVSELGLFYTPHAPNSDILEFLGIEVPSGLEEKRTAFFKNGNQVLNLIGLLREGIFFPPEFQPSDAQLGSGVYQRCRFHNLNLEGISRKVQLKKCLLNKVYVYNKEECSLPLLDIRESVVVDGLRIHHSNVAGRIQISDTVMGDGIWLNTADLQSLSVWQSDVGALRIIGGSIAEKCSFSDCTISRGVEVTVARLSCPFEMINVGVDYCFSLLDVDFEERVTIVEISWDKLRASQVGMTGSHFDDLVSLAGSDTPPIRLFADCHFSEPVIANFRNDDWRVALLSELREKRQELSSFDPETTESGCRELRRNSERLGNLGDEQFWHRNELESRSYRDDVSVIEKALSGVYRNVSLYGISIYRPFTHLFSSTLLFALVYSYVGGPNWFGTINLSLLEEGLGFSLHRTLPIGLFSSDSNEWRAALVGDGGDLRSIAIRSLATLQSLWSAILIYIGVMSIRRKFRIG